VMGKPVKPDALMEAVIRLAGAAPSVATR
jgi:hypothetical protein